MRSLLAIALVASLLACLSCAGGSNCSIPTGTSVAVSRANASGACSAAVVSGVTSLNGGETFTPMKNLSCGVTHFTLNVTFFTQDSAHESCQGSDAISFQDLQENGGSGTDTMTITCGTDISCSETFDVTFKAP
jgi:hypothetical protein